jgi:hypothetical protein
MSRAPTLLIAGAFCGALAASSGPAAADKADKEPVSHDRLVDESVWRDAKTLVK